ncbi:hypothetical protein KRR39_02280 [Nocardioides panacis]|uniref:Sensor histidine kinase n=1 Tax=Nocardioides panacis TaxID=2849501 RepID=A0A975Y0Q1_9ACTN|nr:histidine kinase [Nocardioides panacis]QWZ08707.1 hypothetical protein KRR39_02280 [Nocardioides panacis]
MVASAAALVILAVGTTLVGGRVAQRQALREARTNASLLAQQVAAPLVNAAVRDGEPAATARLETEMRTRMRDRSLSHIKLWSADGTVLWADETSLTGRRYVLPADVRSLFGTRNVTAEVSGLDRAENVEERDEEELLEVYAGTHDADGRPIVFEAYLPLDDLRRDETAIITGVLAVGIGGLVLFQAAVLPMALRLARRVEQSQAEHTRIVRHALDASELERRRIAEQLHDGVIQDMAGIAFALPTVETRLADDPAGQEARQTVRTITDLVRRDADALRSMLIDLYPPDLAAGGLSTAIHGVADRTREEGVEVVVELDAGPDVPLEVATLAYRVVREGLRNVVKHGRAASATVRMTREPGAWVVTVTDDGVGPEGAGEVRRGHFGLQLLTDTVHDLGGTLTLGAGPTGGSVLRVTIPPALAAP